MTDDQGPIPGALTMQQVADLDAEYNVLLRHFIRGADGMNSGVAIAALMSAAACVAVSSGMTEEKCAEYIKKCADDILANIPPAYEKIRKEKDSGGDTGKESEDSDQVMA